MIWLLTGASVSPSNRKFPAYRALFEPTSGFPQFNDLPHLVRRRSAPEFQKKGAGNFGIGDRHSTTRIYKRVDVLRPLQAVWRSRQTHGLPAEKQHCS